MKKLKKIIVGIQQGAAQQAAPQEVGSTTATSAYPAADKTRLGRTWLSKNSGSIGCLWISRVERTSTGLPIFN